MSKELWKKHFEGRYAVSNLGRVKQTIDSPRITAGQLIPQFKYDEGYLGCGIFLFGRWRVVRVHILVAEVFKGKCPKGKEVNHKNGKKWDNRTKNLEYVTRGKNLKHAYALGLKKHMSGALNPRAKYTAEQIKKFRKLFYVFGYTPKEISERYKVNFKTMEDILMYRTWSEV